jgi:divalent metal cation (Fe/Co/Zn/Cd) transporter
MTITRELAQFFEEYRHFHGVRSRRTGGRIFIEIFLEFDPQRSVGEIQAVAARLRQSIQEKIPHSAVSIALADGPPH